MATEELATEDTVIGYLDSMSNWGRWGEDDQKGTLNLLTEDKICAAAGLVTVGRSVSLSRLVEFAPKANSHEAAIPPIHFMGQSGDSALEDAMGEAYDWAGFPLHGHYVTHLDSHSHLFYNRATYNGTSAAHVVTDRGALKSGVDLASHGIVSRGVLLDVPRARGTRWLEGSDAVTPADLEAAERQGGLQCESGDVVLVRTGYGARRGAADGSGAEKGLPGLAPECLPWIRERDIAVIGTDTGTDQSPARFRGRVRAPVHLVCIVAMGMWIIDNCDLESVAEICADLGRSSFLFSAAPLRLKNSTGSPFNPLAIF
jgi:kynurenine formamidase